MARKLWVAVDVRIHTNEKINDLANALGLDVDTTVGKLIRLWAWAKTDEIEDGRIGRIPAAEIAGIMRWNKKPEVLIDRLITCGLLSLEKDGSLWINDWYEYNGKATEQARKERDRKLGKLRGNSE